MRLGRFELPTSCFGGTRSIHLSYSRTVHLYHALRVVNILNFCGSHLSWKVLHAFACRGLFHAVGNDVVATGSDVNRQGRPEA